MMICYFLFCVRQRKLARRKKTRAIRFFFLANVTLYFRPVYAMTTTVQRNNVNCYCRTASEKPYPRRSDRSVRDRVAHIDPTRPAKIGRQQVSYAGLRTAEWLLIFSAFFFLVKSEPFPYFFSRNAHNVAQYFRRSGDDESTRERSSILTLWPRDGRMHNRRR